MQPELTRYFEMTFPKRLARIRKERGLTQQALADATGVHVTQIQRYEWGSSQPTLDVLRKLSVALGVDSDTLVFARDERGPHNELKLKFEAIEAMSEDDQRVISSLIDAYIKKRRLEALAAS
jgi:transcriptional regulator with XRE-family HTH domain